MSYARWGEDGSAVYVFGTGEYLVCMQCMLFGEEKTFTTPSPAAMLAHLERHREQGDKVPDRALERLREESDVA